METNPVARYLQKNQYIELDVLSLQFVNWNNNVHGFNGLSHVISEFGGFQVYLQSFQYCFSNILC